jgi:UDP-glucose 4-epimerase
MEIRNMRVLITGGAGFIGSHLTDELVKNNHVLILDNFSSGERENIAHHEGKSNVEIIAGDIRNKDLLAKITKNVDVVYHLAVQCLRVSIKNPDVTHEVNATGTLNLLKASLENSVKRFIYVSSSEVYGTAIKIPMSEDHPLEPITVYGASKLAGELYALAFHRTYGLESIVIRPFNTYGPREHLHGVYGEVIPRFVLRIVNDASPIIFGDGNQTRDFTYISDTVRGIILASECDTIIGQAVNIARGQEVSITNLAEIIAGGLNKKKIKPVYETTRPGDVMRHYADITKAKKLLGFSPEIDIGEGISLFIDWFTSKKYDVSLLLKQENVINW